MVPAERVTACDESGLRPRPGVQAARLRDRWQRLQAQGLDLLHRHEQAQERRKATWKHDIADLSAEWVTDAAGASKGSRFELALEKDFRFGHQVMITPRLGASWHDKKYVDDYYGVRAREVTASHAAYVGKGTVNAELGLRAMYLFDRQNSVFLDLGVKALGKEIKNSPLVDRRQENQVFMGYLYRF